MQLFDKLFAYEERTQANRSVRTSRFVKNNAWYVNEHYMKTVFAYPVLSSRNKIPGLYRTNVYGLMKNFLFGRKTHEFLPSTADVILIKITGERLRGFYASSHGRRHTVKIVCDSHRCKLIEAAKREVAVRGQLVSLNTINIPKVLGTEQRGGAFLFSEEMILGRRFNARVDGTLYRRNVLPQLRDTYRAYGVRYDPIQNFLPPGLSERVMGLLGEGANRKRFRDALHDVIERNGLAAVSLCHGGLAPSNIAVADGKVFFLDWETAHEGVIAFDLLGTALKYLKLFYMAEDIREIMTSNFMDRGCGFEEMLTAGVGLALVRKPNSVVELLDFWQRHVS